MRSHTRACALPIACCGSMNDIWDLAPGTMIMFDRITFSSDLLAGRACIRGMRITVSLLVNLVANGMSPAEIISEYPDIEPEDIR